MALEQSTTQSTFRHTSSPSLQQREEAALAKERALAREVERLAVLRAGALEQLEQLERLEAGAPIQLPKIELPDLALAPVLAAIRVVREDALRQRAEAAELLERRIEAMQKGLSQANEGVARGMAALRTAKDEADRAAREAAVAARTKAAQASAPVARDDVALGDTLISSLARFQAAEAQPTASQRRRASPRVDLVAAVDLSSDHNFFNGFSSDISAGGLFVTTCERAELGAPVHLKFTLPGGLEIEAEGEVRWLRELSEMQPELLPGVGVAFTAIAPESVHAIETFVARREPMFFPDA